MTQLKNLGSSSDPTALLDGSATLTDAGPHLWGFGGLHGGLALAVLAGAATRTDGPRLRSITGHFLRPARDELTVDARTVRRGRTMETVAATLRTADRESVVATATFGRAPGRSRPDGPRRPDAGRPEDHATFTPPIELVPISQFTDIRPVGSSLPFAGGDRPELMAWIRLVDDDTPVDVSRLVMLADALAPSYTAILTEVAMVPTVELTVRPSGARATSPWLLVRARTTSVSADGWIDEHIDLWSDAGVHMGSAHQLRALRPG